MAIFDIDRWASELETGNRFTRFSLAATSPRASGQESPNWSLLGSEPVPVSQIVSQIGANCGHLMPLNTP